MPPTLEKFLVHVTFLQCQASRTPRDQIVGTFPAILLVPFLLQRRSGYKMRSQAPLFPSKHQALPWRSSALQISWLFVHPLY